MDPLFSATISSGRSGRLPPLRADECNGGGVLRRCKATGVRAAHLLPLGRNGARQRHGLDRRLSPLGEQGRHDFLWLDATAAAMGGGVTGAFDGIPVRRPARSFFLPAVMDGRRSSSSVGMALLPQRLGDGRGSSKE